MAENEIEINIESLGFKIYDKYSFNASQRKDKEQEWLKAMRQFKGVYDPEILAKLNPNRSKAYPKLTRSKCISVRARLHEIAFPDNGKSWSIEPSAVSTIPPNAAQKVYAFLQQKAQMEFQQATAEAQKNNAQPPEGPAPITQEEFETAINLYAKEACKEMEIEIADQLLDTGYEDIMKSAIRSSILLGTGLAKGPMVKTVNKKRWVINEANQFVLSKEPEHKPYLEFVRVWDWYPDMSATEHKDSEFDFERHIMTKHQVRKLIDMPDFNGKAILEYLDSNPGGDVTYKDWEVELQVLAIQDNAGEIKKGNKYEVIEGWGYVDARDLSEIGVTVPEELQNIELQANVWLLGRKVIKIVLNPMPGEINPYHILYFEKDETSIFGTGLPMIMRGSAITVATAARLMLDNAAICAGPQLEVNTDLLRSDEEVDVFYPFKVWPRTGSGVESQYPAVRVYGIDSHMAEYKEIIQQFMEFADLETAFPTYMLIEPSRVGNETASGASLRHGSINITVKDVARMIDRFQASIIKGLYDWNMDFNPKEEIKGDYVVNAKGLSSLIAKEIRSQILQGLNSVLTPEQKAWIKEHDYMEELFKSMDIPIAIVRTEEEYREYIQSVTDPRMMELQIQELAEKVRNLSAKSLNMVAMAKEKNIKSAKLAASVEVD